MGRDAISAGDVTEWRTKVNIKWFTPDGERTHQPHLGQPGVGHILLINYGLEVVIFSIKCCRIAKWYPQKSEHTSWCWLKENRKTRASEELDIHPYPYGVLGTDSLWLRREGGLTTRKNYPPRSEASPNPTDIFSPILRTWRPFAILLPMNRSTDSALAEDWSTGQLIFNSPEGQAVTSSGLARQHVRLRLYRIEEHIGEVPWAVPTTRHMNDWGDATGWDSPHSPLLRIALGEPFPTILSVDVSTARPKLRK